MWYCTSTVLFHVGRPVLPAVKVAEAGGCQVTRVVAMPDCGSYATQLVFIVNAVPTRPKISASHEHIILSSSVFLHITCILERSSSRHQAKLTVWIDLVRLSHFIVKLSEGFHRLTPLSSKTFSTIKK